MTAKLHIVDNTTHSDMAADEQRALNVRRAQILDELKRAPGSFNYTEFKNAITLLGDSIPFESFDELFQAHINHQPTAHTLESRTLQAILSDSQESEVLLDKIERIRAIGLTGI